MRRIEHAAARCVWDLRATLGEGPVWVEDALWFVDIKGPAVHRFTPATDAKASWPMPEPIGCLLPAEDGSWIAALRSGFATLAFGPPGAPPAVTPICDPEADIPGNRFNDGKRAPDGSVWAGTMDDAETEARGAWWRLAPDGGVAKVDDGYGVTNGPAFDAARGRVYLTDSAERVIYAADWAPGAASVDARAFKTFGADEGIPDGMTVDAVGALWVAFWDGGCVRRFSPEGALIQTIDIPTPRPTSVAFADDGRTLYVTSAAIGLAEDAPLAGALFAVDAA